MQDDKADSELAVAISALQHYSYCPRQCGLIHLEQTFEENLYTLRGRAVHEQVDTPDTQLDKDRCIEYALPLFSHRLGWVGKADVVEFAADGTPYPVEYKHGPRRPKLHDEVQLAAQAMCLEEMTGQAVSKGAIFHHSSRRRREVEISPELRAEVERLTELIRVMLVQGQLPPPVNDARCRQCSLKDACQPEILAAGDRLQRLRADLYSLEDDE
jgi:CRISPR-associated exonuclease Cas4